MSLDKEISQNPVLDADRQKKAREYSRIRRRLGLIETGLSLLFLLALIFTGFSRWFTGLFDWPAIPAAVVYFLVLIVAYEVLLSPLSYYGGFVLPHRYGLSIQTLRGWLTDLIKGGLLGLIMGAAAVAAAYWLLARFPDVWWLLAWGLVLVVSIVLSVIAPVFLVPLFYKVKPLAEGELRSRLEKLAEKAGARVRGIYTLDFSARGTTANAGLMGIGRTRRIVISDTLVEQYTIPEIEIITAHEIGHHVNRDIFRLFLLQAAAYFVILRVTDLVLKAILVPLGYSSLADPAGLPLLVILFGVFSTILSPVMNSVSRYVESQADGYALSLTDNPRAFINAMTRLANQNLAVAYPPGWEELLFYDHPSYNKRVQHARRFEEG